MAAIACLSSPLTLTPPPQAWSPKVLVYGDMGREGGSESLPALYKEAASGDYAAILHVGDFAYDLDSDGGEVCCCGLGHVHSVQYLLTLPSLPSLHEQNGDEFMRRLEPIAAAVPYMTSPGNHGVWHRLFFLILPPNHVSLLLFLLFLLLHSYCLLPESGYNFSHYLNRFSMPSYSSPHWYSWDIGPVHFVRSGHVSVQLRPHYLPLCADGHSTASPSLPPSLCTFQLLLRGVFL